jgi:hypothetical protein
MSKKNRNRTDRTNVVVVQSEPVTTNEVVSEPTVAVMGVEEISQETIDAEPIDPTEDMVGPGEGITLNEDGTLAVAEGENAALAEHIEQGTVQVISTEEFLANGGVFPVEVTETGLTAEEVAAIDTELGVLNFQPEPEATIEGNVEIESEGTVETTSEVESTNVDPKEAEQQAVALYEEQANPEPTAPTTEQEVETKVRGAAVAKRWSAGTVKDGREVMFGKDVAKLPDDTQFVVTRKDNPKRGKAEKRFNTILLKRVKTLGEYRKLQGTKLANDDFAWDVNHGFYSYEEPGKATVETTGSDSVAA